MNRDILKIIILSLCFHFVLKFLANVIIYNESNALDDTQIACLTESSKIVPMPNCKILKIYPSRRGDLGLEYGFFSDKDDSEVLSYYDTQLKKNNWVLEEPIAVGKNYITSKYKNNKLDSGKYYISKNKKNNEYEVGIMIEYKDQSYKKDKVVPFYAGWTWMVK